VPENLDVAWAQAMARYAGMDVPAARFNIALLTELQDRWGRVLRPVTSMFDLWFVRPNDTYPFAELVIVAYEGIERVRMTLRRDLPRRSLERSGGPVTVTGDFARPENALPVVEALLLQLADPTHP
jgi:hypothetical protein